MRSKPPTKAQRWQRKRAMTKGHITSIIKALNTIALKNILTLDEKCDLNTARVYLGKIINKYDSRNYDSKMKFMRTRGL